MTFCLNNIIFLYYYIIIVVVVGCSQFVGNRYNRRTQRYTTVHRGRCLDSLGQLLLSFPEQNKERSIIIMNDNEQHNTQQSSPPPPPSVAPHHWISPRISFILVAFSLGQVGDGLNIFQGIYLVGLGWNEGSVGMALSLMGLTALIVQPFAGNLVDITPFDRRIFLAVAAFITACSASAILLVREGNSDHALMFFTKIIEGVSSSFIGPCLAALTLATFGPHHFDSVFASVVLYGHVGTMISAVLAGLVAYWMYPDIKYCFLVIGASALLAVLFTQYLPQGDQQMGRGFQGEFAMDKQGHIEKLTTNETNNGEQQGATSSNAALGKEQEQQAAPYWEVFSDRKTLILCLTGFFFQ